MGAATPAKLGRYQVVKHLASGGMAEVLLARATGIEGFTRHVVIKRIRTGQADNAQFIQMFLSEARLAAQLHHQNIVQVHDIGQEGEEYFFAMEYVHGEDLRRLLTNVARRGEKVPLEQVIAIIAATANALHYAHEQIGPDRKPLAIVHRDVSPANILVSYDGHVKVVDFGIAKAAASTHEATVAGALKGKASYMAPEQCTGKGVIDRRTDVFALGIVLYELATARRLFKGANDFLTMSAVVAGNVPPAKTHRPDLPDALDAIIMKALSPDPAARYQTASDMQDALEQFAQTARLRSSSAGLAAYMKRLFGERPEPWLVEDDSQHEHNVDFDGSASGMARPPTEAVEGNAIPEAVEAMKSSPIMRARTKAATNAPPLPIVSTQTSGPIAKPRAPTRQIAIPEATPDKPQRRATWSDARPVPTAGSGRRKPKTVQIPVAQQASGAGAPVTPRAPTNGGLPGVTDDGVPKDIDASWDPSRPMAAAATASMLAAEQASAKSAAVATSVGGASASSGSAASALSPTAMLSASNGNGASSSNGAKPSTAATSPPSAATPTKPSAASDKPSVASDKPSAASDKPSAASDKPSAAVKSTTPPQAAAADKPVPAGKPAAPSSTASSIDKPGAPTAAPASAKPLGSAPTPTAAKSDPPTSATPKSDPAIKVDATSATTPGDSSSRLSPTAFGKSGSTPAVSRTTTPIGMAKPAAAPATAKPTVKDDATPIPTGDPTLPTMSKPAPKPLIPVAKAGPPSTKDNDATPVPTGDPTPLPTMTKPAPKPLVATPPKAGAARADASDTTPLPVFARGDAASAATAPKPLFAPSDASATTAPKPLFAAPPKADTDTSDAEAEPADVSTGAEARTDATPSPGRAKLPAPRSRPKLPGVAADDGSGVRPFAGVAALTAAKTAEVDDTAGALAAMRGDVDASDADATATSPAPAAAVSSESTSPEAGADEPSPFAAPPAATSDDSPFAAATVVTTDDSPFAAATVAAASPFAAPAKPSTDEPNISAFASPATAGDAWGADQGSLKSAGPLAKLLASRKRMVIAAGAALLLLIVIIVVATGGDKKKTAPTASPDKTAAKGHGDDDDKADPAVAGDPHDGSAAGDGSSALGSGDGSGDGAASDGDGSATGSGATGDGSAAGSGDATADATGDGSDGATGDGATGTATATTPKATKTTKTAAKTVATATKTPKTTKTTATKTTATKTTATKTTATKTTATKTPVKAATKTTAKTATKATKPGVQKTTAKKCDPKSLFPCKQKK